MLKDADHSYFAGVYIVCGYTDLRFGIDSIRWLPSLNAGFICICLYLTPSSFSVAGLPPGSKGFSGKAMDSCSFTNA